MSELSHQTKMTLGLFITIAGVVFGTGFFYAKQEALAARVDTLELDRQKTAQMSEDIAVIKEKVSTMDGNFQAMLTKLNNSPK